MNAHAQTLYASRIASLAACAAITALALLPAVGRAAEPDVAGAHSTGGLVADANTVRGPNETRFMAAFVIPGSTVASHRNGSVDLAKPWAVFHEADRFGTNVCYTEANPSSWSAGEPVSSPTLWHHPGDPEPLDGVSFDASCPNSGSGFDRFRVTFNDRRDSQFTDFTDMSGKAWGLFNDNGVLGIGGQTFTWGPGLLGPGGVVSGNATGQLVERSTKYTIVHVEAGWLEAATASVCGLDTSGAQSTCWLGHAGMRLDPSQMSVVAY